MRKREGAVGQKQPAGLQKRLQQRRNPQRQRAVPVLVAGADIDMDQSRRSQRPKRRVKSGSVSKMSPTIM